MLKTAVFELVQQFYHATEIGNVANAVSAEFSHNAHFQFVPAAERFYRDKNKTTYLRWRSYRRKWYTRHFTLRLQLQFLD